MNMYLIAYLRTYYRIITDRRMIYKKDSEKKNTGQGRERHAGKAGMGKAGPPCGRMMAGAGWAARNLLIEGP